MIRVFAIGLLAATAVSSAMAADLIVEEPIYEAAVAANDWDGFYVGIFGGYAAGTANSFGVDTDIDGWLVGGAVGANFTVSEAIVAGIVADLAWTDISGVTGGADVNLDWVGSVRGRLGINGGAFLPYLTGGLAVAGVSLEAPPDSTSATYVGWTAGAGVEFAATDDLSIDLLYRYSDYGSQDITLNGITEPVSLNTHQVTVGLNWGF
jgi:outer membrane immunogenic protein